MSTSEFVYRAYIGTTPDKLWQALTSSEFTQQYWGGRRIESDWQTGSPVRILKPDGTADVEGTVLQADKPRLLSYTWVSKNMPALGPTQVTFELQDMGETVRFTLTHTGVDADNAATKMVLEGWTAILSSLKSMLETGKPLVYSFWRG